MSENKRRVLVVDDDAVIRDMAMDILSPEYEVMDAFEDLRENKREAPGLGLLDLGGSQCARRGATLYPRPPARLAAR